MRISFHKEHIDDWAEFSQDYNPIHFNIEEALKAGSDSIIVHGMLAMLPIKSELTLAVNNIVAAEDWIEIHSSFLNAVPVNRTLQLSISNSNNRGRFVFTDNENDRTYFKGRFKQCKKPTDMETVSESENYIAISPDYISEKIALFNRVFSNIDSLWIWVDGLIFSHFLKYGMVGVDVENGVDSQDINLKACNAFTGVENKITLQTTHTVLINRKFILRPISDIKTIESIEYVIIRQDVFSDENGRLGSVVLPVKINGDLLMQIEIGLLLK